MGEPLCNDATVASAFPYYTTPFFRQVVGAFLTTRWVDNPSLVLAQAMRFEWIDILIDLGNAFKNTATWHRHLFWILA
jgi:hypothetical protein